VASAAFDGVIDRADGKWQMADGSMTDLILDQIQFQSTEIGDESESVPRRSVHFLPSFSGLWGPLYVEAPVQSNMLNIQVKSISGYLLGLLKCTSSQQNI